MLEKHKITSSDTLFTLWTNLFTVYSVYNIYIAIYYVNTATYVVCGRYSLICQLRYSLSNLRCWP